MMTRLPRARGRIVVVAIFSEPPSVDLHRIFWRELRMIGTRVYEHEDFTQAILLADTGRIPLESLISDIRPLAELQDGFLRMQAAHGVMKVLIDCANE